MGISEKVAALHRRLWERRHEICPLGCPHVQLLHPRHAAEEIGFTYEEIPEITDWPPGRRIGLAGMVDPSRSLILISDQFGPEVARFTGAHEVGHAILHPGRQFRERPMGPSPRRDHVEFAADQFAASFLMPRRLVVSEIKQAFGPSLPIRIDEVRAFHFDAAAPSEFANAPVSAKARALAAAHRDFDGGHIIPLHQRFEVSIAAMAIRIEELGLVVP